MVFKRKITFKLFFIFVITQTVFLTHSLHNTQANTIVPNNYTNEIEDLKKSFQLMKEDYESKLKDLENRVSHTEEVFIREHEPVAEKQFYGTKGSIMNPDISIIADAFYHFSDQSDGVGEFTDNDLFFREVELAVQGYVYPGVMAEFFPVWEVEEDKVEIEEAFANFLTLPFNTSLLVGRQRVRFGLVNPIHQHSRGYVDVPLVVQNFLGAEGYIDDGIEISTMVPKIPIPLTVGIGVFDGNKSLGEDDEDDEENGNQTSDIFETSPVEWKDHVFLAKINGNVQLSLNADASFGYHVLWDDNGGAATAIHNGQFALTYQIPNSYKKLFWQNEIYFADFNDRNINSKGLYSLLNFNLNRFLDSGVRYDWSELADNDNFHQWAVNPFMTYHLTEATYVRLQYKYAELEGSENVNTAMLQFVWGVGPHSHSLKN